MDRNEQHNRLVGANPSVLAKVLHEVAQNSHSRARCQGIRIFLYAEVHGRRPLMGPLLSLSTPGILAPQ